MKRDISFLAELGFVDMPASEVAAVLLDLGYDSIEWSMAHLDSFVEPACAIACQQDLATDPVGGLAVTKRAIEVAAERGVPTVNVLTGPNLWEDGAQPRYDEQTWAAALGALEAACSHAEPLGVDVALEPCWGSLVHDAATLERAMNEVPCMLNLDPSHFVMEGNDSPAIVRQWKDRLVHVHLKDAFGTSGHEGEDFLFCMLGEGKVPWSAFIGALDDVGYDGPLSVEFEAYGYLEQVLHGDPRRAAALAMEQVQGLLAGEPS